METCPLPRLGCLTPPWLLSPRGLLALDPLSQACPSSAFFTVSGLKPLHCSACSCCPWLQPSNISCSQPLLTLHLLCFGLLALPETEFSLWLYCFRQPGLTWLWRLSPGHRPVSRPTQTSSGFPPGSLSPSRRTQIGQASSAPGWARKLPTATSEPRQAHRLYTDRQTGCRAPGKAFGSVFNWAFK